MTNESPQPVFFSMALYQSIVAHARSVHPEECCGLVASDQTGSPVRVIPMTNTLHSPVRYQMDPKEQFSVGKSLRLDGMSIWESTIPIPSRRLIHLWWMLTWPTIRIFLPYHFSRNDTSEFENVSDQGR